MAQHTFRLAHRHSRRRAFTLTELVIVVGIMGLVLGGIWAAASMVQTNNKAKVAQDQIAFILTGYRTLYGAKGIDAAAAADVTCIGVNNDYFPKSMVTGACTSGTVATYPQNLWNGYVRVDADPGSQAFQIGYYNISTEGCNRLAALMGSASEVIVETVNGHSTGYLPPMGANVPFTVAQISGYCATGNVNTVAFYFLAR